MAAGALNSSEPRAAQVGVNAVYLTTMLLSLDSLISREKLCPQNQYMDFELSTEFVIDNIIAWLEMLAKKDYEYETKIPNKEMPLRENIVKHDVLVQHAWSVPLPLFQWYRISF